MSYKDRYIKYKSKYVNLKNQIGGDTNNFLIIDSIRGNSPFLPDLKKALKSLNNNVDEYEFKFKHNKYVLDDLTFETVCEDIKNFINKKEISNCVIICLEESSPYGLFFADTYPELCRAIICYPLRLNTKESLDRLHYKYVEKNGWKHISKNYDVIDYFFEINNTRLNELFNKNEEEEKNIIELLINLQLRKQYDKISKIFKIPTYLFSRLDMDSISTIQLNFERKDIAEMKGILSPDDAVYTSMMWNIAKVQYDKELIELNEDNLRIHYMVAFEKNKDVRLILDAVKILTC